jgi:hypothetical protein
MILLHIITCLSLLLTFSGIFGTHSWQFSADFLACQKPLSLSNESKIAMHFTHGQQTNYSNQSFDTLTLDSLSFSDPHHPMFAFNQQPSSPQESWQFLNFSNAHKLINFAAMLYAGYKIYMLHKHLNNTYPHLLSSDESIIFGTIKTMLKYICPQFLLNISAHGQFLVDSAAIIIEALVYKTIGKLILLCGKKDIFDSLVRNMRRQKSHA